MKRCTRIGPAPVSETSIDITDVLTVVDQEFTLPIPRADVRTLAEIEAAEVAASRRWTLKAWLLTTLPADEMVMLMGAAMPPTIAELYQRARARAEEHAGKCASCGARPKNGRTRKPYTPTKGK